MSALSEITAISAPAKTAPTLPSKVALLTGGFDRHYAFGLATALAAKGVCLDVIGSDEVDSPEFHERPQINFLNLRGSMRIAGLAARIMRVLAYYARLMRYAATSDAGVFHILWNNKFDFFDRTLLMFYYKACGKKVVLTAHNVNAGERDATDSSLNRFTLRLQYRLADHILVHTQRMKSELMVNCGVREETITVMRHPINVAVPDTALTPAAAKRRLGLGDDEKAMLFFGNLAPYKGLEYLIDAFEIVARRGGKYRLIVAGQGKPGCEEYVDRMRQMLARDLFRERAIVKIEMIPDQEVEVYFKAADVSVLPYTYIFQSGVLFLGYGYGLPAIAADVGSFREDVLADRTGFIFHPRDTADLANKIEAYFTGDFYRSLSRRRREIREFAHSKYSWDAAAEAIDNVYARLLENCEAGRSAADN